MPGGEVCVRTFRSAVGALNRPIKLFLEPASGLLVELLVSRTQAREREPDLVDCIGDGVEQLLPRLGGSVRHVPRIGTSDRSDDRSGRFWTLAGPDVPRGLRGTGGLSRRVERGAAYAASAAGSTARSGSDLAASRPGASSASSAPTARTTTASGSAATTPSVNACGFS